MCIATPFSKHPRLRSPKGPPRRFEGTSASLEPSRARDVRVSGRTRRLGRTAEPVTRRSGQGHNGDGANEGQTNDGKVASTWQDQGTLTVHRLRKTVPLIRSRHARIRCEGSCGVLRQAHARKQHSALRSASSAFQKKSGASTANSASEQIPLQLKPHR